MHSCPQWVVRVFRVLGGDIVAFWGQGLNQNGGHCLWKIRDKAKSSNAQGGLRSVEFLDHVGCSNGLANDYHGTIVSQLRLPVKRFLDLGVANENQGTWFEVKIVNPGSVALLELLQAPLPELGNHGLDVLNILGALRELLCTQSDQLLSCDTGVLCRREVGRLDDVKGEKRVNTVCHVIGGETGCLADGNALGP